DSRRERLFRAGTRSHGRVDAPLLLLLPAWIPRHGAGGRQRRMAAGRPGTTCPAKSKTKGEEESDGDEMSDFNEEPNDLRDVQPTSFRHIIGQRLVTEALQIAVEASFQERKRLDEVLLTGPPGLGKSALVTVLAAELAVPFTEVLAQSVTNTAELNAVLLSA